MWFRRKIKDKATPDSSKDSAANKIAITIIRTQQKFADLLAKKAEHLSHAKLKIMLLSIGVCWFGWSICLVIKGFITNGSQQITLQINRMNIPKYTDHTGEEKLQPQWQVTKDDYAKLQKFRKYMDSLAENNKRSYDSILLTRPHLMDTVLALENFYKQQNR